MSEVLSEKASGYVKAMRHEDGFEWKAYYDADGEFTFATSVGGRSTEGSLVIIGDSRYVFTKKDFVFKNKVPSHEDTEKRMKVLCEKLQAADVRDSLRDLLKRDS